MGQLLQIPEPETEREAELRHGLEHTREILQMLQPRSYSAASNQIIMNQIVEINKTLGDK